MLRRSFPPPSRDFTKRAAFVLAASPAAAIVVLFVLRPEALGSPATKLALMTFAGCLLMTIGEVSEAFVRWAQPRLTGATLTAAPESTRF